MNTDTNNAIEEIMDNQWYPCSKALGDGGWREVRKFSRDWKTYVLTFINSDDPIEIVAANDEVAKGAFQSMYDTEGECQIMEKIVTFRVVCTI